MFVFVLALRYAATTLGSGNLRQAVALPPGEDPDEWIAVNSVDFFNQVKLKRCQCCSWSPTYHN